VENVKLTHYQDTEAPEEEQVRLAAPAEESQPEGYSQPRQGLS
jgi:hypothetical protein